MKKTSLTISVIAQLFAFMACTPEENTHSGTEGGGGNKTIQVTGITLDKSSATIKEGESVTLVATVKPGNADNKNVSWTSRDAAVASVDNGGKVTGIKAGSATVTAKTEDGGKTASCVVTVQSNAAPSVTVSADNITAFSAVLKGKANLSSTVAADLQIGFQYSTSAGILPSNATTIEAIEADASYNYTTKITGLEPDTKYYFRSYVRQNNQYTYGETKGFKTNGVESFLETLDATGVETTSASLNAKLDLTDIKYKTFAFGFYLGNSEAEQKDLITLASEKIIDNAFSATLTKLSPNTQYWYKAFVELDNRSFFGEIKTFTTNVVPVDSVSISEKEYALYAIGATVTLKATVFPSNATDKSVEWSTSNADVATVDANGKVTATGEGTAVITVTTKDQGKTANCTITVKLYVPVESVSLDKKSYSFGTIGATMQLKATVLPSDATDKSVEWSTGNPNVATVDANGKVKATGNGNVIIKVKTKDQGKTANCAVTVIQYPTGIKLNKSTLTLNVGENHPLEATVSPENAYGNDVTWRSSDRQVATVDNNGVVTAVACGIATISASVNTFEGSKKEAKCKVEVIQELIDLGLSVKWRGWNLGANRPGEYGDYYAWGETDTKSDFSEKTYKWWDDMKGFTKYCTKLGYGTVVDNKTVLDPWDDVVRVKLKGNWRMPTDDEWVELLRECSLTWTNDYNGFGVAGIIVTSKTKGTSIFLPAAGFKEGTKDQETGSIGFYWSTSLFFENNSYQSDQGAHLYFRHSEDGFLSRRLDGEYRYNGLPVRPVSE